MVDLRLKEFLDERNIKPVELAEMLNLSSKAKVYDWLNGKTLPNFNNLITLCDMFECSIDYFLCRTEDDNETKFKNSISFDETLKNIMKSKNVTQYQMFKEKIVNPSHFNKWFIKKSLPNIETLIKLADYFKISIDELVGRV